MTKTKVEFSKMNVNILRVCNHIYFRLRDCYTLFSTKLKLTGEKQTSHGK